MGVLIFLSKISKRQSTPVEILDLRDSFSLIHALAYSFIGFQTVYLATNWNSIYWNTACLIVNSGSLGSTIDTNEDIDNEYEDIEEEIIEEDNNEEKEKEKATDYAKIAKALGEIISKGIKISLIDINKSLEDFIPDEENNQILFGLKALSGINNENVKQIIDNRPYKTFKDFLYKCRLNKTAMVTLIKSGAFDKLELSASKELNIHPRVLIMAYYIYLQCNKKDKLNLQNFNELIQRNLVPESLKKQVQVYNFNKFLKANKKTHEYFLLDGKAEQFYNLHFDMNELVLINGQVYILQSRWEKIYQKEMLLAKEWIKGNQNIILKELKFQLFKEMWNKYAQGSISTWEMASLCFYYHEHELINVDTRHYGISDFNCLPSTPVVEYYFQRKNINIPIYKIYKIIGTVISKNDAKATVTLLTTTGVVTVKFTKEYYAMYKKQISEKQADGTKKVMEKGWMIRGTKLMIAGYRREDQFVAKTYKKNNLHQIYLITLSKDGKHLELQHDRYKEKEME